MQSEMNCVRGLRRLCAPMLSRAERLPEPRRDALRTAFGIAAGRRRTGSVGLAVLSLLAGVAGNAADLPDRRRGAADQASAQALGFTARRLAADPVGLGSRAAIQARI